MIEAARSFRFGGRQLVAGDQVVGEQGQTPTGRCFTALLRTGKIIIRDNITGAMPTAARTRTETVARRGPKAVTS